MKETQKQMLDELNTSSIGVLDEMSKLGFEYTINDGVITGIVDVTTGKEL